MNNFIYEYWQGIKDGSIVVGKWIRLLYELVVNRIEDGTYIFDQGKANNAIRFIEKYVRHNKGKLAPQVLKLSLWQKATISLIFGIVDSDGVRIFREIFLVVGRKCGKTLLASGIIAYIAYCAGEYGSEIYCVAPKLDQSDLVFSAFEFTKDHTPAFEKISKKRKNDILVIPSNTTIKKIAFNEKKADGYNPMLTVCDEMSSWPAVRGNKQYEVMLSGTGAREAAITLSISSAGYVNEGPFDELFARGTRFLMGNSSEQRLLPIIYMIDDIEKWDDINELRKSLPALGVSVSVNFILDEINTARESLPKKTEFITKMCNVKQNSSQAWLSTKTVKKSCCEEITKEFLAHSYCVGGIDLSQTTDLTSACVVVEKNGIEYVLSHFWMPEEKLDEAIEKDKLPYKDFIKKGWLTLAGENFVDYKAVLEWFVELVREYEILPLVIGYDRYSSQYLINDMKQFGFKMDDVYQGHQLYPILMQLEGTMKDGRVKIGDNNLMKVHLLNSAIKMDQERGRGKLVKISPSDHIDGVAALVDALTVKSKYSDVYGHQLKNERRENKNGFV